jgi:hypothetical protein
MPGFIQALNESFAELKRSLVYPKHFLEFSQGGPPAQKDLAVLYARCQARLQELNWADTEGIGWLAAAALERQPGAASVVQFLVVDGFDSFTGAQFQAPKMLSLQVGGMLITFPGRIGSQRLAHRRFTGDIERLLRELSPGIIPLDRALSLPPDLLHTESQLFETENGDVRSASRPLLLEARSPADEAREALRWIRVSGGEYYQNHKIKRGFDLKIRCRAIKKSINSQHFLGRKWFLGSIRLLRNFLFYFLSF